MIGRRQPAQPDPPVQPGRTATELDVLAARIRTAVRVVDDHIRHLRANQPAVDALLDVRNTLKPPKPLKNPHNTRKEHHRD